jgi:hypothetical protein
MKKVFISLCLLYAANGEAVVVKALVATASPVLVPGLYYAAQAYIDRQRVKEKFKELPNQEIEREVELLHAQAPLEDYLDGVCKGFVPPLNIAMLTGTQSQGCDIKHLTADAKVGFFSGLSVYGTYPAVLLLLSKMPK